MLAARAPGVAPDAAAFRERTTARGESVAGEGGTPLVEEALLGGELRFAGLEGGLGGGELGGGGRE
jgi:hypothetical protein